MFSTEPGMTVSKVRDTGRETVESEREGKKERERDESERKRFT